MSLGKLRTHAHLVKNFFQLSNHRCGSPCCGFPLAEERFYAHPCGSSTHFFNFVPFAFASETVPRFPEAEAGIYPTASGPSTLIFSNLPGCLRAPAELRLTEVEECIYPSPSGPSTLFFNFLEAPLPFDAPRGFPQQGGCF